MYFPHTHETMHEYKHQQKHIEYVGIFKVKYANLRLAPPSHVG